jgi:dTDP-4-dehydrorhamnose 3,5-epimerase
VAADEISPRGEKDEQTVDSLGRPLGGCIEGVEVERVTGHVDARGSLTPFMATASDFWREPVVYAYAVMVHPGRIKGWGLHRRQADRYFVPPGRLRVVLHDGRAGSPSFRAFQQVWFSESSGGLVRIPPGVWHADQNWGEDDVWLVNFPTEPYNAEDPDKYRIDPHGGQIEFDWELGDG